VQCVGVTPVTPKVPVEIRVAQGIYKPDQSIAHPDGTRDRLASFVLLDNVAIMGGFAGVAASNPGVRDTTLYETILSGDLAGDDVPVFDPCDLPIERTRGENSGAIVRAYGCSRSAVLDGFTITSGSPAGLISRSINGSGLDLRGSEAPCCPSIRSCIFVANLDAVGVFQAAPEFVNCVFTRNASTREGGALGVSAGNQASPACPFIIQGCTFADNYAKYSGGAIYISSGTISSIEDCTFTENFSRQGGALFVAGTSVNVANCLFVHNRASDAGGAVYFAPSRLTMTSCSFFGNTAPQGTGAACLERFYKGLGPYAKISNMILRDGGDEIHVTNAAQVDATYSNIQGGWPGRGNIDVDPLFANPVAWSPNTPHDRNAPYVAGDYHLKSQAGRWDPNSLSWVVDDVTSPCIDAGDPEAPVGEEPEPNGERINMGAYGGAAEASKSYAVKP
jgi:predicted outer membrane repeat protein